MPTTTRGEHPPAPHQAGVDAPPAIVRPWNCDVEWLGRIGYQAAWDRQHALVAARAAGETPDTLLLLEHDAVLTLGRHADPAHILRLRALLAARGIETLRVERGGEVTYHGPGQLVAYPIVRLADAGLLLRPFVRALELAMADTARELRHPRRAARRVSRAAGSIRRAGRAAPEAGRPRPARREGRHLPRHRAQRHHRPGRLRAHRPLRHDRHHRHLDRAGARLERRSRRGRRRRAC